MEEKGTRVRIISKHGYSYSTLLSVEVIQDNLRISWRLNPEKLGVDMMYLKEIVQSTTSDRRLHLLFQGHFELEMEFEDAETCSALHVCLESLLAEAHLISKEKEQIQHITHDAIVREILTLQTADFQTTFNQEMLYQLVASLKLKEGRIVFQRLVGAHTMKTLKDCFSKWGNLIKERNAKMMDSDKRRWRLHAISNQEVDLQAWYHAVFFNEIYRLRGPFWYKDAALPVYRSSYSSVVNALTPLEESALAHVLCSADTVYGDVAGQMFVVQALVEPAQFHFFQHLASQGAMVTKYPRTGRPTKKLFRFSFVEGKIYLTWKGRFGNQGVDLGEVSHISSGLSAEVKKRESEVAIGTAPLNEDLFLSLVCAGRSVDLCYESEADRDAWKKLLDTLCSKEHGKLNGVEAITPVYPNEMEAHTQHTSTPTNDTRSDPSPKIPTLPSSVNSPLSSAASKNPPKPPVTSATKGTPVAKASANAPKSPIAAPKTPKSSQPTPDSFFLSAPTDGMDCTLEWSVLYSTIGPEIVPKHIKGSILELDAQMDNNDNNSVMTDGDEKIDFSALITQHDSGRESIHRGSTSGLSSNRKV